MHTHMHAIEEDINLKQLTGLIILGQALSSGPTSGQHLGTGMATFSCVRAQRTGRRLHKWNSRSCFLTACNFWVFGEAIQWTTDYPQGHTTDGDWGETSICISALSALLPSRKRRSRGWGG
jgi:hypothetical protein